MSGYYANERITALRAALLDAMKAIRRLSVNAATRRMVDVGVAAHDRAQAVLNGETVEEE